MSEIPVCSDKDLTKMQERANKAMRELQDRITKHARSNVINRYDMETDCLLMLCLKDAARLIHLTRDQQRYIQNNTD